MQFSRALSLALFAAPAVTAFSTCQPSVNRVSSLSMADSPLFSSDISKALDREIQYTPGKADHEFARKFGHLAGADVKTSGEAFTSFTDILSTPVNALYKGICTDLVGTLHLIVVNARFTKDPVFSLGLVTALDLFLKNYPEQEAAVRIKSAMLKSVGLDEAEVDGEAAKLMAWAEGKSKAEITSALKGEGDSMLSEIASGVSGDQYWMYSRFFGIGLIKMMEMVGVEQDESAAYDVMEEWMNGCMGKMHYTACNDSDLYFKQKGKLDMMETMMKEIEIREKKRMAERLEAKAEMAVLAAEKAVKMQEQIDLELAAEEKAKEAKQEA